MNTLPTGNRNIRTMYETCSKLTIKTLERRRSGVFIINFEQISIIVLVLLFDFEPFNLFRT